MPVYMGVMCDACRRVHFVAHHVPLESAAHFRARMFSFDQRHAASPESSRKKPCARTGLQMKCFREAMRRRTSTNSSSGLEQGDTGISAGRTGSCLTGAIPTGIPQLNGSGYR